MLNFMERAAIYCLKQKGWNNTRIAEFTGHHRDTIARVLKEEMDKKPQKRHRTSAISVSDEQIGAWLDKNVSVKRGLEMARAAQNHPYRAGETAFYDCGRKIRRARKQTPAHPAIRCHNCRADMTQRITMPYDTARASSSADFLPALELAAEQHTSPIARVWLLICCKSEGVLR
jgi:hypothetical protein